MDSFWADRICCPRINLAVAALESLNHFGLHRLAMQHPFRHYCNQRWRPLAQEGPEQTVGSIKDT
jgi:hypothetical protein